MFGERLEVKAQNAHPPYIAHLTNSSSLTTPYENTRAGFVAMALEKNAKATPMVAEARDLQEKTKGVKAASKLREVSGIDGALLTAAGISDKAATHLTPQGKEEAIQALINTFLEPAGDKFLEELVFRFLLIRGDSLGGAMRNVVGALAQRRFSVALLARFRNAGTQHHYLRTDSNAWVLPTLESLADAVDRLKAISWDTENGPRTLCFNLTIPPVGKNIDMSLLSCGRDDFTRGRLQSAVINNHSKYLALGELKGGIDPAGADEHWKTANSALARIRNKFAANGTAPRLFFIGGAIERSMADEIWAHLQDGTLSNAANLTVDAQLASLCDWLAQL